MWCCRAKCQNWCPLIFLCITLARTRTRLQQRLPNIQCLAMCNVTYWRFRKFQKLWPRDRLLCRSTHRYSPLVLYHHNFRGPRKVKSENISDMNIIGPESNTINHKVYDLISSGEICSLTKTRNEIKPSVYISLFLFAFSVGRIQIWYSLFPSILSQQICFPFHIIFAFDVFTLFLVWKKIHFKAKR